MVTVFGKRPLNEVIRAKWRYRWEPRSMAATFINEVRRNKKDTQPSASHEDSGETNLLALLSWVSIL